MRDECSGTGLTFGLLCLIIYSIVNLISIQFYLDSNHMQMLHVHPNIPLKETLAYLANFPRFSLIEKIEPKFFQTSADGSKRVAQVIRDLILAKSKLSKEPFVLGLATGNTPLKVYKQLITMYKKGEVSFKNVITFNLDEYYPISKDNRESYNYYMRSNFFDHIDIPKENINIPDGELPKEKVSSFCDEYEQKIRLYGGIDLQLLGIGRTGHIGFNQPPSPIKSTTRLVYLHRLTRKDAANSFNGIQNVPKCAITMGIETISRAKKIIIMAWSETKAQIVKKSIEGPQTNDIPSTFLHNHPDSVFYLDKGAGEDLTRFKIPWTIKGDKEDPIVPNTKFWICKMVQWLCHQVKKPILRLTFEDFEDNGLSHLVMNVAKGKVEDLNLYVYKQLNSKITGWPLGDKPANQPPEIIHFIHKNSSCQKRVLVFSPHPDDDVISMGGTLHKLKDQGHHTMVAYMTSGANAVHDHELQKYIYFLKDLVGLRDSLSSKDDQDQKSKEVELKNIIDQAAKTLIQKKEGVSPLDSQLVRKMKGFIRSSEAKIAVESFGIPAEDTYCMKLPFYAHHLTKKDISEDDKVVLRDLLKLTRPDVIFAAGDLTDPHGTHRKCLQIILQVQHEEAEKSKHDPSYKSFFPDSKSTFFYRGAWEEWELAMCRMIVPLSPVEVEDKIKSILKHQSQKDFPMFPGDDKREFWMRSKERNRNTAAELKELGLPDYEAVQCFVNLWDLINYEQF